MKHGDQLRTIQNIGLPAQERGFPRQASTGQQVQGLIQYSSTWPILEAEMYNTVPTQSLEKSSSSTVGTQKSRMYNNRPRGFH